MLATLSRRGARARVRKPHICACCPTNILRDQQLQLAANPSLRASATPSFSTSSSQKTSNDSKHRENDEAWEAKLSALKAALSAESNFDTVAKKHKAKSDTAEPNVKPKQPTAKATTKPLNSQPIPRETEGGTQNARKISSVEAATSTNTPEETPFKISKARKRSGRIKRSKRSLIKSASVGLKKPTEKKPLTTGNAESADARIAALEKAMGLLLKSELSAITKTSTPTSSTEVVRSAKDGDGKAKSTSIGPVKKQTKTKVLTSNQISSGSFPDSKNVLKNAPAISSERNKDLADDLASLRSRSAKTIKGLSIGDAMRREAGKSGANVRRVASDSVSEKLPESGGQEVPPDQVKIKTGMTAGEIKTISAESLELTPVNVEQPPVPSLSYGLERVLFNPGVYHLQDPRSRVFNFDPYLQTIMPVDEFDFTLLKKFITSSRDEALLKVTKNEKKKYTGSTSSMTSALSHFHYLLSQWRPINPGILSKDFPASYDSFTALQRTPAGLFLRWKDGVYAIDADKQYDTANVLSMLGQSMEKLLTLSTEDFEKYRKNSLEQVSEESRKEPESYHYTTMGDFLMRSQLDAYDPRIPGTGMFDLKTRAVVSIRMDTSLFEEHSGYEIRGRHGEWESFEREYYDMIRAAFMKYSLQVRMGRMDGVFVAYHNTERIFGFQYISLPEMDLALHGTEDTSLGDSEFKVSLELLNRVLDRATAKFPEQSIRLFFETRGKLGGATYMYIFAEPIDETEIETIQTSNKSKIEEFENRVLGLSPETEDQTKAEWETLHEKVNESMELDENDLGETEVVEVVEANEESEDEPPPSPWGDAEVDNDNEIGEVEKEDEYAPGNVQLESAQLELEDNDTIEELDENSQMVEDADDSEITEEADELVDLAEKAIEENVPDPAEAEEFEKPLEDSEHDDEPVGFNEAIVEETIVYPLEAEEVEASLEGGEGEMVEEIVGANEGAAEGSSVVDPSEDEKFLADKMVNEDANVTEDIEEDIIEEARAEDKSRERGPEASALKGGSPVDDDNVVLCAEAATSIEQELNNSLENLESRTTTEPQKEILAMYLTIRNKVNDKAVRRPVNLTPSDDWKIEYALAEIGDQAKAKSLYEACKRRRKLVLVKEKANKDDAWNNKYLTNIKKLSDKGRLHRKALDEIEAKEPAKLLFVKPSDLHNVQKWTTDGKKED